jgi:hypothetical protein
MALLFSRNPEKLFCYAISERHNRIASQKKAQDECIEKPVKRDKKNEARINHDTNDFGLE